MGTQIILKGFGYYTIGIDTWFGPATYTAVRLYQNREGISSDGIVGSVTYNRLLGELAFRSFDASWTKTPASNAAGTYTAPPR